MTYCYERLINLMKDANLQFENIVKIGLDEKVFETGLLLCRRVGGPIVELSRSLISIARQLLLSAMCLSVVRDHLV